ncbi:hypothetical protein ABZ153_00100 [Streptomyces sp. NPDC006290]|uniref:hypothetical protein n=1 Tax=Streptomyces sp. NPDC006290 TaxID=3156745 RepID=UPI0033BF8CDE
MNAFSDSPAHVFVFVAGVAVTDAETGALGVESPAGSAEAPVPPDDVAGVGEPADEAVGPAALPDGEEEEPAASAPGWHAVMRSVAADMVAIARAVPRTRDPKCIPYCMKSPD